MRNIGRQVGTYNMDKQNVDLSLEENVRNMKSEHC